ncbi:MAG: hypothetical protein ACKOCT_06980, partial [Alphaproteobacteria bacterium]
MDLVVAELDSPIGPLVLATVATVAGRDGRVAALTFGEAWPRLRTWIASRTGADPSSWRAARGSSEPARRLR